VTASLIFARLSQRLEDVEDNVANVDDRCVGSVCQIVGAAYFGGLGMQVPFRSVKVSKEITTWP